MIGEQKVIGVIPARGGSKGIVGKNTRILGGKPMIAWTILAAKKSRYLDRVVLSSDDEKIIDVALTWGCEAPFKRQDILATDDATTVDVIIDVVKRYPGFDWVVVLQPTSPLRIEADIDGALEKCFVENAPACVSVCQVEHSPYWMFWIDKGILRPILESSHSNLRRRQDLPPIFMLNGAVYVIKTDELINRRSFFPPATVAYEMPLSRSLDIDNEQDLKLFEIYSP